MVHACGLRDASLFEICEKLKAVVASIALFGSPRIRRGHNP